MARDGARAAAPHISPVPAAPATPLPETFAAWFAGRGWAPRAHQLELLRVAEEGRSALLVAPTGAGKTLAGFLPSLVELSTARHARANRKRLHTLYVSPLKALAVDVARNVETPAAEMATKIRPGSVGSSRIVCRHSPPAPGCH